MDAVVRTATKQSPQWRRLLAWEDEGGEKSNELVRHGTTGATLLGGPRRGHRGGGWRRRGRSGAERPRQRFGERKAQEEPGGADFFWAQARGRQRREKLCCGGGWKRRLDFFRRSPQAAPTASHRVKRMQQEGRCQASVNTSRHASGHDHAEARFGAADLA